MSKIFDIDMSDVLLRQYVNNTKPNKTNEIIKLFNSFISKFRKNKVMTEKLNKKVGNFISNFTNAEPNRRVVEIYRLAQPFNTPLYENAEKIANCGVGDFVLIIGDDVWVQDNNEKENAQFVQAIYSVEFVRINPLLFSKA